MTEQLPAAKMRAIEQEAIASGRVTGLELMERAGQGVVDAIYAQWPDLRPRNGRLSGLFGGGRRQVIVMCGPGNNGGDGFVVARRLHEEGWQVSVYFHGRAEALPGDAAHMYRLWSALGPVHPLPAGPATDARLIDLCDPHPDLWVDAFFGLGVNRPLPEPITEFMRRVYYEQNWNDAPIVAVDINSGLNADTGRSVQQFHLTADLTTTFHTPKPGHFHNDGPERSGKLVVVDIGL